jgi:hypothetical protein
MEKVEFLEQLKQLVANTEVLKVSREINELKQKFEDFLIEEERLRQVALLEAGEPVEENKEIDPIKEEFYEINRMFQLKRKDAVDLKKEVQENNLKAKRTLINQLSDVIQNEENIGKAYNAHKDIHEKWKLTGDIPRDKRDDIQAEYSRLLESFFYNMKIYKELKEHDLHRNEQLKLELIQNIQALIPLKSMKETETQLKALQNDWDEIGPVGETEWEKIKEAYWSNVKAVYAKINVFYDERRVKLSENIDLKKALIAKAKETIEGSTELSASKEWESKTAEVLAIQEEWKKIGFGPKKENDEVWKAFRAECDVFFNAKKIFFDSIREESKHLVVAKQGLIDQAKELNTSTDWKETANKLINLQKKWKDIGHTGHRTEQKLWKDFRAACDVFFNARQAQFAEKDKENEANLAEKQALIHEITAFKMSDDKKQGIAELKDFATKFNAIGHVPMKVKDQIYNDFKKALDKHYVDLKLEGAEKEKVMFQAKMDTFQASPNSGRLMDKEKTDIRRIIDTIKQENIQFENNLGFFGRSKGADEMKKDFEKKIEKNKEKIEELKRKLKLIPNE